MFDNKMLSTSKILGMIAKTMPSSNQSTAGEDASLSQNDNLRCNKQPDLPTPEQDMQSLLSLCLDNKDKKHQIQD